MKLKNTRTRSAIFKMSLAATLGFLSTASYGEVIQTQSEKQLPSSLAQKVKNLRADLTAKGYEIAQGDFHLFTIEDCKYAIQSIGNCLGNNPTAPYVIPSVPLWPDEFADEHMKDLLGPLPANNGWTHRLDEREAIVILGLLPPPGRYFGIQPYIFSREGTMNLDDQIYRTLTDSFMKSVLFMSSPNPSRPLVFSSVGDSINNVVIEKQSGAAFDQQRSFIITSDATLGSTLSDALLRAGVPNKNEIFTLPVPPSFARLGLGSAADDFITLIRYALPNDEVAGEQWRNQIPLAVLRIRDRDSSHLIQPYAMAPREQRVARSEINLKSDANELVATVKKKWGQPNAHESEFFSLLLTVDLIGENCIKRPMNCLGDTADADYQVSQTTGIDSGEVLAVVGTLGTATGNAVYTSLSVNRLPELVGTSNLTDLQLTGTAAAFSSTVENTDKLYVQYFARDCSNIPQCFVITEKMVPRGGTLKLIQRNYVVPGSNRGPAPSLLVNPRMIIFKK